MNASCYAKIASLLHQGKVAELRANAERKARATFEEKQAKIIQSYNDLHSFHQTARTEYESLELAFKRLNSTKAEESRKREFTEHLLMCEKYTRDQAEKNMTDLLASMKILASNFHSLIIDRSTLPKDEKKAEGRLDYGSLFIEKEALRHERNQLLIELAERDMTVLSLRNQPLQHT